MKHETQIIAYKTSPLTITLYMPQKRWYWLGMRGKWENVCRRWFGSYGEAMEYLQNNVKHIKTRTWKEL